MRERSTPKRLGAVGPDLFPGRAYATSSGIASFGTGPQRRDSLRRRGLGREQSAGHAAARLRQPHAGHRRHPCGARQAGHRPVRMRAHAHRRRSAEGQELRHPAEHHDALHADHVRRQGAEPRTVSRRDQRRGGEGGAQGATPRRQGEARRRRMSCSTISTMPSPPSAARKATASTRASCSTSCGPSSWTRPARN